MMNENDSKNKNSADEEDSVKAQAAAKDRRMFEVESQKQLYGKYKFYGIMVLVSSLSLIVRTFKEGVDERLIIALIVHSTIMLVVTFFHYLVRRQIFAPKGKVPGA